MKRRKNLPKNLTYTLPEGFAQKADEGQGANRVKLKRTRPAKSKKIRSIRERVFQVELARIRGTDIPLLPKEKKIPEPVLLKPKKRPKRSLLDQVRDGLRGTRPA